MLGGRRPEDVVRRWHCSTGSVLICTHEKFRNTGEPCLARALRTACRICLNNVAADRPTCAIAVLALAVGRPRISGGLDAQQSLDSVQPGQAASLPMPPKAAAPAKPSEASMAEMLREGAEVVVVDEAHVLKNDQVRACLRCHGFAALICCLPPWAAQVCKRMQYLAGTRQQWMVLTSSRRTTQTVPADAHATGLRAGVHQAEAGSDGLPAAKQPHRNVRCGRSVRDSAVLAQTNALS